MLPIYNNYVRDLFRIKSTTILNKFYFVFFLNFEFWILYFAFQFFKIFKYTWCKTILGGSIPLTPPRGGNPGSRKLPPSAWNSVPSKGSPAPPTQECRAPSSKFPRVSPACWVSVLGALFRKPPWLCPPEDGWSVSRELIKTI